MDFGVKLETDVLFYGLCSHKINLKSRTIFKLNKYGDNKTIFRQPNTTMPQLFGRNLLQINVFQIW